MATFHADQIARFLGIAKMSIPKLLKAAGVVRRPNPNFNGFKPLKYLPFTEEETEQIIRTFHRVKQRGRKARY